MEYFISHIGPIAIVAVILAAICLIISLAAAKSHKISEEHGYDPDWDKSHLACQGCKMFAVCSGQSIEKSHEQLAECGKDNLETAK